MKASEFDDEPDAYERARPEYPPALWRDLFDYAAVERPLVLEAGAGTGKATTGLLTRAASVTAVELGPNLADLLDRNFAADSRVQVVRGTFEEVGLPRHAFDLVAAATAWHWFQPDCRLARAHELLRTGRTLAIIDTNQVASDVDRGFFRQSDSIYHRHGRGERWVEPPGVDLVPAAYEEVVVSPLFEDVRLLRYRWDQQCTAAQYADLVRSYSTTQSMPAGPREALVRDLAALIDAEFGGAIVRPLVITLVAGRTTPPR